jgi:hypothetical protein
MMLGDLLAQFDDETTTVDTIFRLGDLRMIAALRTSAEAEGLGLGAFATRAVQRYAEAPDEEWITLLGELGRSDDPGLVFIKRALAHAMRAPERPEPSACRRSTAA